MDDDKVLEKTIDDLWRVQKIASSKNMNFTLPFYDAHRKRDSFSSGQLAIRYGTWGKAMDELGFTDADRQIQFFNSLKFIGEYMKIHGRLSSSEYEKVKAGNMFTKNAFLRKYRTWNAVLAAADEVVS